MNSVLFDTDVIIDILRNQQDVVKQIQPLASGRILYCSCVTVGEVFAGMHQKEEALTRQFLSTLIKIPVTEEIAELAGRLKYETKSHILHLDDCLIAATAILYDCLLLTKNVKHYPFRKLTVRKIG